MAEIRTFGWHSRNYSISGDDQDTLTAIALPLVSYLRSLEESRTNPSFNDYKGKGPAGESLGQSYRMPEHPGQA